MEKEDRDVGLPFSRKESIVFFEKRHSKRKRELNERRCVAK